MATARFAVFTIAFSEEFQNQVMSKKGANGKHIALNFRIFFPSGYNTLANLLRLFLARILLSHRLGSFHSILPGHNLSVYLPRPRH